MSKKVFELAKELDLKPLDLVEELKNKGFNVKNHMAALSDEELSKFMAMRTSELSKVEDAKNISPRLIQASFEDHITFSLQIMNR